MYRHLSLHEISEILQRHLRRQSKRAISRDLGLGRATVNRYIDTALALGLGQDELAAELVATVARTVRLRPVPEPSAQRQMLAEQRELIRDWLIHRRHSLTLVRDMLENVGVNVSYATLRRFAIRELGWVHSDAPGPVGELRTSQVALRA